MHAHMQFSADASAVDVDGNLAVDHAKDDSVASLLSGYMGHYGMCTLSPSLPAVSPVVMVSDCMSRYV